MTYSRFFSSDFTAINLTDIPQDDFYRFFIDRKLVDKELGWIQYENREPGCLAALCKAAEIAWFHEIENTNIDIDLIKSLHKAITSNVKNLNSSDFTPGEFRKNFTGFRLNSSQFPASEAGIYDILQRILQQHLAEYDSKENQEKTKADFQYAHNHAKSAEEKNDFASVDAAIPGSTGSSLTIPETGPYAIIAHYSTENIHDAINDFFRNHTNEEREKLNLNEKIKELAHFIKKTYSNLLYRASAPHIIPTEMDQVIQQYNTRIIEAKSREEKLSIIADSIWEFEHIHPFRDANTRVFVVMLCNRLLLQQGFGLVMFNDPNMFDGFGKEELAKALDIALKNTRSIVQDIHSHSTTFDTQNIPEADKQRFQEWSDRLYTLANREKHLSSKNSL